jgi:hypothetical protein
MTRVFEFTLALAMALAASTPALAEEGILLPPGFDGTYAPEGMACEGLARIEVKDGVMVGGEFAITVTDIVEHPTDPRKVEASLLNSAGGEEWVDSAALTLTEDGQSLRFDYPDGGSVVWVRCP